MSKILQPGEIVEIGIEKERKRRDFYALAAERFKDKTPLAELFGKLRDWEESHIERFTAIRDTVAHATYAESYGGEMEAYMQAVVESELYREMTPEEFAGIIKTPADALDKGIGFEKDAILFFSGLSGFLDEKGQAVVKKLIAEEQQHMLFLFEMKKELAG
ncbi:MAG: hypothetical protein JW876_10055 [Candidatus Krumholzibacteriota bacterium]|nr:hypothetical protein [Candidatus Krumholzibacteriota bacterium]